MSNFNKFIDLNEILISATWPLDICFKFTINHNKLEYCQAQPKPKLALFLINQATQPPARPPDHPDK